MGILSDISNLFKRAIKEREQVLFISAKEDIDNSFENMEIVITDLIELEFKDPREIGIVNPKTTSFTRFNQGEFEEDSDRIVKGIVTRLWKEPNPINEWFIEVLIGKRINVNGELKTFERKLLLMSSEIKWIKKR